MLEPRQVNSNRKIATDQRNRQVSRSQSVIPGMSDKARHKECIQKANLF